MDTRYRAYIDGIGLDFILGCSGGIKTFRLAAIIKTEDIRKVVNT